MFSVCCSYGHNHVFSSVPEMRHSPRGRLIHRLVCCFQAILHTCNTLTSSLASWLTKGRERDSPLCSFIPCGLVFPTLSHPTAVQTHCLHEVQGRHRAVLSMPQIWYERAIKESIEISLSKEHTLNQEEGISMSKAWLPTLLYVKQLEGPFKYHLLLLLTLMNTNVRGLSMAT